MSSIGWRNHLGRAVAFGGGLFAIGAVGAVAAGMTLARKAVIPDPHAKNPVIVTRMRQLESRRIVWISGEDAGLPGKYSFIFDDGRGRARLGEVIENLGDATSVAREVEAIDRGELGLGAEGRITGWWFDSPEELGFRTERISYPTEHGDAEAWVIHPRRTGLRFGRSARAKRWAVHVHGRGALPEETLRGVAPLARAGITSLVISYRNDPGAPRGENGRYGIGIAESRDVDAAIAWVRRQGAERVTLFGWSMGGTACLVSAAVGAHTAVVDGLILDSPAIDWAALLSYHAKILNAPRFVAEIGIRLLDTGIIRGGESSGIDFGILTPGSFAKLLTVPTLIHASTADTFVPCEAAAQLAAAAPDRVQLRLQTEGEHVKLWNVDPEPWERVTEAFARAIPRPPWRGE